MPRWLMRLLLTLAILLCASVTAYLLMEWTVKEPLEVHLVNVQGRKGGGEELHYELRNVSPVAVRVVGVLPRNYLEALPIATSYLVPPEYPLHVIKPFGTYRGRIPVMRFESMDRVVDLVVQWTPASEPWFRPLIDRWNIVKNKIDPTSDPTSGLREVVSGQADLNQLKER